MDFAALKRPVIKGPKIVASTEQISSDLNGEAVLLNLKNGVYYGLNEVGAEVWSLLQQPKTIPQIRDALLEMYDVEPRECEAALLALLQKLADAQLIELTDEKTA